MSDLSMILLSFGMLLFFMGPFVIISAIKDRQEARRKQKVSKQYDKRVCRVTAHPPLFREIDDKKHFVLEQLCHLIVFDLRSRILVADFINII